MTIRLKNEEFALENATKYLNCIRSLHLNFEIELKIKLTNHLDSHGEQDFILFLQKNRDIITQVEGALLGVSVDIIFVNGTTDTWGGLLPTDFADASSYSTFILADPSLIAAPDYGTGTSAPASSSSSPYDPYDRYGDEAAASSGFEITITLTGLIIGITLLRRFRGMQ